MYELLCFHAQQAAEKSLKAVLISRGISFPRTHDLKLLIEWLPAGMSRLPLLMDAVILTEYAVVYRYPGASEPITDEEYHNLVRLAEAVVAWAEGLVTVTPT